VVEHRVSGLVTAEKSPDALEKALFQIASDAGLREALSVGARRQAEARFAEPAFLRATLEVFEQALDRRRVRPAAR
jgi:glycosyltransferase involved in cell wall biosynthesis